MGKDGFHKTVATYYDQDVDYGFESKAESNPLLDRIRSDFRAISSKYPFNSVLEIGCGPGFDLAWFAKNYPDAQVTGIDISKKMVGLTEKRIKNENLTNASVLQLDERGLEQSFEDESFDLIYVFFGALNTVSDLQKSADEIHRLLRSGGHAVLTFVNKWYLREMIVQALKLNYKLAFARLKKEWGGYSPNRHLPSRCYSPKEVLKSFAEFTLIERKGYSIFFPAWYNPHKVKGKAEQAEKLWARDQKIQNSALWSKGEYTLFVLKKE